MLLHRVLTYIFWSQQVQRLSHRQSCLAREAEICSASIKPLSVLVPLGTKKPLKNPTRTKQPLSVTSSLAFAFLAYLLQAAVLFGHQCRDFSPSLASQALVLSQAGLCSRVLAIIHLYCRRRRDVLFVQAYSSGGVSEPKCSWGVPFPPEITSEPMWGEEGCTVYEFILSACLGCMPGNIVLSVAESIWKPVLEKPETCRDSWWKSWHRSSF